MEENKQDPVVAAQEEFKQKNPNISEESIIFSRQLEEYSISNQMRVFSKVSPEC